MNHFRAALLLLILASSGAFAGEIRDQLLGKWRYVSKTTNDGPESTMGTTLNSAAMRYAGDGRAKVVGTFTSWTE